VTESSTFDIAPAYRPSIGLVRVTTTPVFDALAAEWPVQTSQRGRPPGRVTTAPGGNEMPAMDVRSPAGAAAAGFSWFSGD
jgi:hypothetical protein